MGVPVRVTLGKPWMELAYDLREEIRELAPTPREFKLNGEEFNRAYTARLDEIGVAKLRPIFEKMSSRNDNRRLILF